MEIGINATGLVAGASIPKIIAHARAAAEDGFSSYWLAEHPTGGFDLLTVLSAVGVAVPGVRLGTAVIPTWPRHPVALAGQAVTVNEMLEGRLTLGVGLSHKPFMQQLGIEFDKPIRHLREFLSVLGPLLAEGRVDSSGQSISAQAQFFQAPRFSLPIMVAALGPQALKVAGSLTDGTVLAWVGPKTIREHIAPTIQAAAEAAGRAAPKIVATLPVCVTSQESVIRDKVAHNLSMYGKLPSYRAMLDREGVDGPADVAIVGEEQAVVDQIMALQQAGVTEFTASEFVTNPDEQAATREILKTLRAQAN